MNKELTDQVWTLKDHVGNSTRAKNKELNKNMHSSVQLLSCVWLCATLQDLNRHFSKEYVHMASKHLLNIGSHQGNANQN